MAKCDLCGKTCSASSMEQLLSSYQVCGIEDLCPSCVKDVNNIKGDYLDNIAKHVKEGIKKRYELLSSDRGNWFTKLKKKFNFL